MNRPEPIASDNIFISLFNAVRKRRVPIGLRIAAHSVLLVSVALLIYAAVMGWQFRQAMQQHADALGQSLVLQTRESAAPLLVANDMLSLNVLLSSLVKNKLVAHAAVYSMGAEGRVLAEAGTRPIQALIGTNFGLYSGDITFQEVAAGHLRITLDMSQFQQPMTISLQSMGILALILLGVSLYMSLRLGRSLSLPLRQLRLWLRDPDEQAPASYRQDEIGDIARQLNSKFAITAEPKPVAAQVQPTLRTEPVMAQLKPAAKASTERLEPSISFGPAIEEDNPFEQPAPMPAPKAQPSVSPVLPVELFEEDNPFEQSPLDAPIAQAPRATAVLAVQLGAQEQLRRLPKARLLELLQRYRDCIEQATRFYEAELHTLKDGSSLMLFHQRDASQDYLTHAICCGELLRALGHQLQVEVADSGITLQLQLAMTQGESLEALSQGDVLLSESAQTALALSQHSRNLLLLENSVSQTAFLREHARIRSLVSPEGASCVERLLEPYPSLVERQLVLMHERSQPASV